MRDLRSSRPEDDEAGSVTVLPGSSEGARFKSARHFRSTWIVSSLEGLKTSGYYGRYEELLDDSCREVTSCIAGAWLPMALVVAHYQACEGLGLSDEQYAKLVNIGSTVRQTWYSHVITAAKRPDVSVWDMLPAFGRIWARTADGGDMRARRVSDHEANVSFVGCELFGVPYFRRAVGFMNFRLLSHIPKCRALKVTVQSPELENQATYVIRWE